ncbi:hypothetical protein TWF718_001821 [Orbilia javanica]|uniref:F-box domain-containing protein n=1 Tax=Orbilia javanica TaxID=47235 RepID=A0AAN8N962_9PEZI
MELLAEPTPRNSILSLPQELFSDIVGLLSLNDRAILLRACKQLYHQTYPHLWRTIDSDIQAPSNTHWPSNTTLSFKKISKLAEITEKIGPDAMGFRYVKELRFGFNDFSSYSPWVKAGLLDVIHDQLVSKKMELQKLKLNWEKCENCSDCVMNFLNTLKNYSEFDLKPPSIIAARNSDTPNFPFGIFALECFTDLHIGLVSDRIDDDRTWPVKEIPIFTKVLSGTISLKRLRIEGKRFLRDSPYPIGELQPQLSELQAAITNLKQLKSLELSLMIFHPSFFITPPESVRKLSITQKVSIAWWRQFARCPFTNVEELRLYAHHVERGYNGAPSTWWSSSDPEANQNDPGDFIFMLNNLAMRGLKRFTTDCKVYYCPEDLLDLVIQGNPGLDEIQRQKYLDMKIDWKSCPRHFLLYGESSRYDIDPRTGRSRR